MPSSWDDVLGPRPGWLSQLRGKLRGFEGYRKVADPVIAGSRKLAGLATDASRGVVDFERQRAGAAASSYLAIPEGAARMYGAEAPADFVRDVRDRIAGVVGQPEGASGSVGQVAGTMAPYGLGAGASSLAGGIAADAVVGAPIAASGREMSLAGLAADNPEVVAKGVEIATEQPMGQEGRAQLSRVLNRVADTPGLRGPLEAATGAGMALGLTKAIPAVGRGVKAVGEARDALRGRLAGMDAMTARAGEVVLPPLDIPEMSEYQAGRVRKALAGPNRSGHMVVPGRARGILAYHGSPHDFDKFSLDAIGTGEGMQAYGHGLYFADEEAVARSYRDDMSSLPITVDGRPLADADITPGQRQALQYMQAYGIDPADPKAIHSAGDAWRMADRDVWRKSSWRDFRREFEELVTSGRVATSRPTGRLYEVALDAEPDDFLDLDAPLSQQPAKVREAVEAVVGPVGEEDAIRSGKAWMYDVGATVDREAPYVAASKALRERGVKGARYLDGVSRGKGEGSYNYVVFDDNIVEILRKYGIAGLLGGGLAAEGERRLTGPSK